MSPSSEPMRVAVVGAGMAGLTAAYRLGQAGATVAVFESEPKAGGRVETVRAGGYVIDTAATAVGGSYRAYRDPAATLRRTLEVCEVIKGRA